MTARGLADGIDRFIDLVGRATHGSRSASRS